MTGTWGRILARYGQSVTLRRGEEEQACRAFLQPVRERREDWYQELPTPLGAVLDLLSNPAFLVVAAGATGWLLGRVKLPSQGGEDT